MCPVFVFFFILSLAKQKKLGMFWRRLQFLFFFKINGRFGPTSGPLTKLIVLEYFSPGRIGHFVEVFLCSKNVSLIKLILPEIAE